MISEKNQVYSNNPNENEYEIKGEESNIKLRNKTDDVNGTEIASQKSIDTNKDKPQNIFFQLKSKFQNYLEILIFLLFLSFIILILCIFIFNTYFTHNKLSYIEKFDKMKSEFPNQSNISWKMLNSSLSKQILKRKPIEKPAVIILVGLSDKVNNFFERLISVVPTECPIYVVKTDAQKTDDLKMHLNTFLDESINLGIRCAYLPDIDKIPPALGQSLQGLTDELNAKYKEMIYIFSLKINSDFNNLNSFPKTDRDAEDFLLDKLREKWEHEMGVERFVALHTRLLVNVVVVV